MADKDQHTNVEFENLLDAIKALRVAHHRAPVAERPGSPSRGPGFKTDPAPTKEEALAAVKKQLKVLSEHPYNNGGGLAMRDAWPAKSVVPMQQLLREVQALKAIRANGQEGDTQKIRTALAAVLRGMGMDKHPFLDTFKDPAGSPAPKPNKASNMRAAVLHSRVRDLDVDKAMEEMCDDSMEEDLEEEEEEDEDVEQGDSDDGADSRQRKKARVN